MHPEKGLEILQKYPDFAPLYEELKRFQMDPILQERYDRRWIDINQSAHNVEKLEQALKEVEQERLSKERALNEREQAYKEKELERAEKEQALKDAQLALEKANLAQEKANLAQEKTLQLQEILKMHGIDVPLN